MRGGPVRAPPATCPRAWSWRGRGRGARRRAAVSEKRIALALRSVPRMLTSLSHSFIYVLDHDEAVDFYVGKLGLEVGVDADLGPFRWLTVHAPGQEGSELVLATPDMGHDEETAAAIRELVTKGGGNGVIFNVDDCSKTYEALLEKGVEFT